MTHLTNAGIRESLKSKGLGDDKVDTFEFGEIRKYVKNLLPFKAPHSLFPDLTTGF